MFTLFDYDVHNDCDTMDVGDCVNPLKLVHTNTGSFSSGKAQLRIGLISKETKHGVCGMRG